MFKAKLLLIGPSEVRRKSYLHIRYFFCGWLELASNDELFGFIGYDVAWVPVCFCSL